MSIVQGRYDMICPPSAAIALHEQLPKSKLSLVVGGHSSSEQTMKQTIRKEIRYHAKHLNQKRYHK